MHAVQLITFIVGVTVMMTILTIFYLLSLSQKNALDVAIPYPLLIEQESADYSESFMENVDLALIRK